MLDNARKGRPVRMNGVQDKVSGSRRWSGRMESPQKAQGLLSGTAEVSPKAIIKT